MQRLSSDRGAVAVMTALLLVPLLVCAGFVIDIGASYVQRRQLQNAADAAALAIARDCGVRNCATAQSQLTADIFKAGNVPNRPVTAAVQSMTANSVTVQMTEDVNYLFGPVIGVSKSTVAAQATASWGSPTGGTAILPLTISRCSLDAQTKDAQGLPAGTVISTIALSKTTGVTPCAPQSGNEVPGGFGWLETGVGCSSSASLARPWVDKDPGKSEPQACGQSDFDKQLGKTTLLPLFDEVSHNDQQYHLYGYAAFYLTSYNFVHSDGFVPPDTSTSCDAYKNRCLRGYFLKFVDLSDAFTYGTGSPNLGARVVSLTT